MWRSAPRLPDWPIPAQFAGRDGRSPSNDAGTSHFQSLFTTTGATEVRGIGRHDLQVVVAHNPWCDGLHRELSVLLTSFTDDDVSQLGVQVSEVVLDVRGLRTRFATRLGDVEAVSEVSFHIERGETVALVGESGSGKSVTALSILGLLESTGRIAAGSIEFNGRQLVGLPERQLRCDPRAARSR